MQEHKVTLEISVLEAIKDGFLRESRRGGRDEKFAHSLSHFLFLWLKIGLFDEDLFRQIVTLAHHLPMEIESLVLMLFSFTRVEKLLGAQ